MEATGYSNRFTWLGRIAAGLFLLVPAAAQAIVAETYLSNEIVPSSVCFLKFYSPTEAGGILNPKAGCTGTLIRDNRLLTAAHCLDNLTTEDSDGETLELTVICGDKMLETNGYVADPEYVAAGDFATHVHDVAIIDVGGNTKGKNLIAPMPLSTTSAQIQGDLAGPGNCIFAGYGRGDDSTDETWGTLRVAQFDYLTPATIHSQVGWTVPEQELFSGPNHAAPGDSGGPVLCKRADGSYEQVAVTILEEQPIAGTMAGVHYSVHETVDFDLDWINTTADLPKLPH